MLKRRAAYKEGTRSIAIKRRRAISLAASALAALDPEISIPWISTEARAPLRRASLRCAATDFPEKWS
jgi:hypothetical protein